MSTRLLLKLVVAFALVVAAGFGLGRLDGSGSAVAQEPAETWNSTMIWRPMLDEAGIGLAEIVSSIRSTHPVTSSSILSSPRTAEHRTDRSTHSP